MDYALVRIAVDEREDSLVYRFELSDARCQQASGLNGDQPRASECNQDTSGVRNPEPE